MRAGLIDDKANREIRPGDPLRNTALLPASERLGGAAWGPGTVHFTAMDADGLTAAFTPSGGWLRASPVIPALGFPLSMRLSNCYIEPANHPNVVAPFKRPRTTISPSLVMKDGKPWLAFGSMGGDQQDQWQLQFLLNRLVFDMPVQEAIEAPKFSSEHFPGFFWPHDFFLNRVRIEPGVGEAGWRPCGRGATNWMSHRPGPRASSAPPSAISKPACWKPAAIPGDQIGSLPRLRLGNLILAI